jgi:hypothetical protein
MRKKYNPNVVANHSNDFGNVDYVKIKHDREAKAKRQAIVRQRIKANRRSYKAISSTNSN